MTVARKIGGSAEGGPTRHAKTVLISVIGLHLVAETALTPFLPQLFQRLYGIQDPGATGLYIWICRVVGLAALPLWGLAARRWPLHKLVLAGLCGSAVLDLLLGLAPSFAAYTVLSTLIVTTNSALLLAYPAFVAQHGDDSEADERARLPGICALVAVFHLSVVVSTMVGAGVLALPEPRVGISAFAVLDTLLAVLTYRILGRRPDVQADSATDAASDADHHAEQRAGSLGRPGRSGGGLGTALDAAPHGASDAVPHPATEGASDAAPPPSGRRRTWFTTLAYAALIGVAFDFSVNVARPFFTEFSDGLGSGPVGSAILFFLPSVSALAVLPLARRCHDRLGDRLLPFALAVGAAGMAGTWLAGSPPWLAGGRLLYGVGLGLAQIAVELRMFHATGTKGPAFTAVETVRSAGLLAAPLAATAAVSHDLALPLVAAAAVQVCAAVLSLKRLPGITPNPVAKHAGPAWAVDVTLSAQPAPEAKQAGPASPVDATTSARPASAVVDATTPARPAPTAVDATTSAGPVPAAVNATTSARPAPGRSEARDCEPVLTAAVPPAYSEEKTDEPHHT